jgi:3-phenylpropionate/cinnamic acid dioxygenase small subunit
MTTADDIDEIRQLLVRNFQLGDKNRMDEWVDTYTDDAVFRSPVLNLTGRDELTADGSKLRAQVPARHWVGNVLIDVEGDEATASSYMVVMSATLPPTLMASGELEDRLRRVDGRWRIAERTMTLDGMGGAPAAEG